MGSLIRKGIIIKAGYIYRYWHYYTNESSREIYQTADAKVMNVGLDSIHLMLRWRLMI